MPLWPGRIWAAAAEQGLSANQAAQMQPQCPCGMLSESPCCWHDCLGANKAPSHSECLSTELGNARKPRGMWDDSGQGAGGGQAAEKGRQDCAPSVTQLLPKPLPAERRGKGLQASPPLASNPPVPTLCLPVPPQLLPYHISHFPAC